MIKKTIKKMVAVGLTTILLGSLMIGCGSSSSKSVDVSDPSKLEEVKLKMYLLGDTPKDFDLVYGKVNEIMKEKINATLDVIFIPWSDMGTKYQLLFQSGENFDMIFTAAGWGYYSQVATKNGFYELTEDMLQKYAPNTYKNEPKEAWKQAKINEKIYMVPSDKVEYSTNVVGARGDLMKKYGIDKITNYADYEKYMDAVSKDVESGIKVIANSQNQNLEYPYMLEKNEFSIVTGTPSVSIGFNINDTSGNVFAFVDTPEYKEYATKMKEFAQKGYWASDSISSKASRKDEFIAGKTATMVWNAGTVANAAQDLNKANPTADAKLVDLSAGKKKTIAPYTNGGVAINAISKNPERALMAIDLLKYDKDINLLTWYGIEGTHYQLDGDNKYKKTDKTPNFTNACAWGWSNMNYALRDSDEPAIVQEIINNWKNNDTVTNPLSSFAFDDSKVKNEMAAVGNVITQYGAPIGLGMEDDVDVAIKEFRTKLTEAGFDKILEECKTQVKVYIEQYNK